MALALSVCGTDAGSADQMILAVEKTLSRTYTAEMGRVSFSQGTGGAGPSLMTPVIGVRFDEKVGKPEWWFFCDDAAAGSGGRLLVSSFGSCCSCSTCWADG